MHNIYSYKLWLMQFQECYEEDYDELNYCYYCSITRPKMPTK